MVEKQLNKSQGEKQMTIQEKMEQAQERIKASQLKDELKYQSTYDKNFHDALYIALHMEIGKEYTFLNSDNWYQPYTITKIKKKDFYSENPRGFYHIELETGNKLYQRGKAGNRGEIVQYKQRTGHQHDVIQLQSLQG